MSSRQEQEEPGPSGLTTQEILTLLHTSASENEETAANSCDEPLLCPEEEMADSDEDDICQEALDRFERQRAFQTHLLQQSGGGLDTSAKGAFEFNLDNYVDRRSTRMGVRERHFNTRLRQRGNLIPDQNITQALQDGLRRAVNQVLATTPDLDDQDRLYFTITSNRLHNNFQGWGLRAGEWRQDRERVEALFHHLAQALNSNEQFEMDDSFQLSITQVHHAPQRSGSRRQNKPGHPTMQLLTSNKRSVIRIQNRDDLCCARALVTAKARVDQHPKYHSIRQGKSLQRTLALDLHHDAKVPFSPCSYEALTAFSEAPSLTGYQIILVDAHRSFHITTYGDTQDKQLILLHDHDHYDVITRLPGFFGSSYVCAHCWKPYDHEGRHRCTKRKDHCRACCQDECPDFLHAYPRALKATERCQQCHRDFFGKTCLQAHLVKDHTGKPVTNLESSVCFRRRRCPNCLKQDVGLQQIARHQCYYVDCPSCHEYLHGETHLCFIQRPTKPQDKKKRKRKHQGGPRATRTSLVTTGSSNNSGTGCKLLEVKHDRIRFIDSLSFFQMPLSAFPKTFGLTELKKGYFPHKFNIPTHQTYVGIVPAFDYYMPETMSPEGKSNARRRWSLTSRKNCWIIVNQMCVS